MSAKDGEPDLSQDSESENSEFSVDDLIYAVKHGILEDVRTLVTKYGVDVNGYTSEHPISTALNVACINGYVDVVKFLIESGADVNQVGHPERRGLKLTTAIHYACIAGDREIVELLLSKGASLHKAAEDGFPPVHIACKEGHVELVNYLLGLDITVDERDSHGNTLLMTAAIFSKYDMVINLLEKGAKVNYRNESDRTPLYMACLGGNNGIVTTLLARGADVQAHEFTDSNPLYAACKGGYHEVVLILLEHGAQLRGWDFSTWNPLHPACGYKRYEVIKTLLSRGVEVDTYDSHGLTPLHNILCSMGRSEYKPELGTTNKAYAIKVLLEYGINPNVLDKGGFTPLETVRASDWGLGTIDHHDLTIMLEYGSGSGVACHVNKCDCKTTTLMCLYRIYRSLQEDGLRLIDEDNASFQAHLKCIIDTYEKYFIKTRLAGLYRFNGEKAVEHPVKGVDWDLAAREAFQAQCEAELTRMKADLINDTNATYFSLLTRDVPALRRRQLLGQLTSEGCAERYPIYGTMIFSSYVRLRRIFLEEECPGFFTITSPPLPPECAEIVFGNLRERDLMNLVQVYHAHLQYLKNLKQLRNSRKRKIPQD